MAKEKNKFDPEIPEPLAVCSVTMDPRAEAFAVFCQRMLGTTKEAPFVFRGEALNGASMSAMVEAFGACYPLTKVPAASDAAVRRAALLAGNSSEEAPKTQ